MFCKRSRVCFFILLLITPLSVWSGPQFNIGVLTDGKTDIYKSVESLFVKELLSLTDGEFEVTFDASNRLDGNWNVKNIETSLTQLQNDPDVDMIMALGFVSSLVAARSENLKKPTFAPLVLDSNLLGLPRDGNTSGVKNLNYLTEEVRFTDDVIAFREIIEFEKLALLVEKTIFDSVPGLAAQGKRWAKELGVEIVYVLNTAADENLVDKIPEDVDAVMVAALPRLSPAGRRILIDQLRSRKLPSYSLIGSTPVKKGMLAATAPDSDWNRLARKNALNMQSVMLGENPGNQSVSFRHKRQLTINMQTARELDVVPRFDVLSSAVLLNEDDQNVTTEWTLAAVARQALKSNLDIQSSIAGVNAAAELQQQARAALKPQFNTAISVTELNDDGSAVISGAAAQRTTSAVISGNKILYSESNQANVDIQTLAQRARESAHRAVELDIVQQATVGFLSVLKAQTLVDIQRRNLNLSRINLNLANDRVQLGSVTAADRYRWQSEVATSRQSLLLAVAQLDQAMDALNKILHRPINERYRTVPASLEDSSLLVSRKELIDIIDSQRSFDRMGELMILQAKTNSPELAQLQFQIESIERQLKSNERAYFSPDISLAGQVSNTLSESPDLVVSNEGETDWNISLQLSLPLYLGGARKSRINQSTYELQQLNIQKQSTEETIELLTRQNLHSVGASFPSIELAQTAALAAQKNLELIQDNYAKGSVSIIEYLDARDASLNADQNATNAVYDFLIDLMNLQRSTAEFDFFLDAEQMQQTVEDIKRYISLPIEQ